MNLERASLLALGTGLLCIGQPWFHALFTAGFPIVLVGAIAYNVSASTGQGDGDDRGGRSDRGDRNGQGNGRDGV